MSSACHGFVQNAWKKDFCSNCFKSKDEHGEKQPKTNGFPSPKTKSTSASPRSILRLAAKKKNKRAVSFSQDVCKVIGYGGDSWSDEEDFELSEDLDEDDFVPDCDDDKQLKSLTKFNTDFNSVKANLLGAVNGEVKKSYTSLLLGKVQTDSDGKKKTLHVSVTPFGGHDNIFKNKLNDAKKHSSLPVLNKCKEIKNGGGEYKTNITLTSFIKNCEPASMTSACRKDSEPETVASEKSLLEEISETLEKNRTHKNAANENDQTSVKSEKPNDAYDSKKSAAINRNVPIKKDSEKPKFTFCKIDIEPINKCTPNNNNSNNELDHEIITNDYSPEVISKSSDEDSFSSKSDSDDDKLYNHLKKDDCLKIQVYSDSDDKTSSDISLDDIRKVDGQSDSLQEDTYETHFQMGTIDLPTIVPKIDASVIFSAEASRESAGEPDGRADPEELSEPPALPMSPPPQMDPRPSFLHGMIKDSNLTRPIIPEKPKLPMKPMSVIKQLTKRPLASIVPQQQQVILQLQQTLHGPAHLKNPPSDVVVDAKELTNISVSSDKTDNVDNVVNGDCDTDLNKSYLDKQDCNSSANLTPNKRKAPRPPPNVIDECQGNLYQRNPMANLKSDSPVVREKEKRERASSCSPKFRQGVNSNPTGEIVSSQNSDKKPEPAPRRSLSLSHDNLVGVDDKKKGKLKFSLRRLLRLGSTKELDKKDLNVILDIGNSNATTLKKEEIAEVTPKPKPRLVIIHPLELNGNTVEVVKNNVDLLNSGRNSINDDVSLSDGSTYSFSSIGDSEENHKDPQNKPPPPPRKGSGSSENGINPIDGCPMKPARPPPPKSALLLRQQKQAAWTPPPNRPADNVYANLGEVRSAIAPRKPERTASMREREAQLELPKKRVAASEAKDHESDSIKIDVVGHAPAHNYDDVYGSDKYEGVSPDHSSTHNRNGSDSDYEFVSNCTSNVQINKLYPINGTPSKVPSSHRKSDCSIDKSVDYTKMGTNFTRSTSLPYCGSETESEIYSPYSFYSCSEVNADNDSSSEFNSNMNGNGTTNKLRVRKGRSVVHKNLEDNYGAVVIANHEALAQVLEQVQQSAIMQPSLRVLKTCSNLRWNDFTLTSTSSKGYGILKAGKRVFHSAVWNSNSANNAVNVTLMLHKEQMASQIVSQHIVQPQTLCLNAVTEFCDLVPIQQFGEDGDQLVQATVVVLAHSQMDTIESFGEYLQSKSQSSPMNTLIKKNGSEKESPFTNESQHEATFMMLQVINGLKCLQARGVEEVPSSLSSFVIIRDFQSMIKSQQSMSCSITDLNIEDGPTSIQMPKANCYGRLCFLQGLCEKKVSNTEDQVCSLCECAIIASKLLLPNNKLTPLIQDLLSKEKAVSLSQVKSILEFALWGPWDVVSGLPIKDRELSLQRWLDLERATVLHGLVRTRVQLNIFEQSHLMFLVRSSSKIMCDASVFLERFID